MLARLTLAGLVDAQVSGRSERCRALIRELGLEQVFELRGFHSKPAELYSEGEISVLSSISERFRTRCSSRWRARGPASAPTSAA